MGTPHKHAEIIKAWADGAEIQYKTPAMTEWADDPAPNWYSSWEFRIKPAVEIPEGFTPWDGGECPVDGECIVEIKLRSGHENKWQAKQFRWCHLGIGEDIIAYKVVKKVPVVRWQWIYKSWSARTPAITARFYATKEEAESGIGNEVIGKAEWTRTEFDK